MSTFAFPAVDSPIVSVVVVAYGGWRWLGTALEALLKHTDPIYELIVVDNGSHDGTAENLRERVDGAMLLFNATNAGFPAAVNQGAHCARGRYLCLLNSDAIVEPGWLPPLLEALQDEPSVGAVVPLFLNDDGTVQEAGSVVDSDGWAFAFGAGDDAASFANRFRREVDYGSAACLLVRRETFVEVGGLDTAYAPAYYEDVDLAFRLRERGLSTVYEPRSAITHVRFGSGDLGSARALVLRNRQVFVSRWRHELRRRPRLVDLYRHPGRILRARDAASTERILLVCMEVPAEHAPMAQLAKDIAKTWPSSRVTVAALQPGGADENAPPLHKRGIEIVVGEPDWEAWLAWRRFHYSAVIAQTQRALRPLAGALRQTQPQAPTVALDLNEPPALERLGRLLAELGVAPP